jgi:hypothetical protein
LAGWPVSGPRRPSATVQTWQARLFAAAIRDSSFSTRASSWLSIAMIG